MIATDDVRIGQFDRDDDDFRFVPRWNDRGLVRGFVDGCPPGLAKKNNGCMPPGLAKKVVGTPLSAALGLSALGGPYRSWYRDNDDFMYRWDDDYIYRVRRDGGLIDALFPYQNRDYYYYPVGMSYPHDYNYYNVPVPVSVLLSGRRRQLVPLWRRRHLSGQSVDRADPGHRRPADGQSACGRPAAAHGLQHL